MQCAVSLQPAYSSGLCVVTISTPLPWFTLTAPTGGQMCQWSTAFYISVFALTFPLLKWSVCECAACSKLFDVFHRGCLFAGWHGFMLLAFPPSLQGPSSAPLEVDHGNVILHGNMSHEGILWKRKLLRLSLTLQCFSPCCSSSVSASPVLPGLFSVVWSTVNVRSPGSPERWLSNGCGPAFSPRAGPCTSG